MSKTVLKAVVAAVVLSFGGHALIAVAADEKAEKPKYSKNAAKPLKACSDAQKAQKYSEVVSKCQEVLALPDKNSFDSYLANQMLAAAYAKQNDTPNTIKAIEAVLDTGFATQVEQNTYNKFLAGTAYQNKNYAKAIEYSQRLIKSGATDPENYTLIAQSYYQQDKFKDSAKFLADYVADIEKSGKQPREQTLQLMSSSYEKSGDAAGASNALEKLVLYYPKPNYWNNLTYNLMRMDGVTDRHILNIYRLMAATDTLSKGSDYTEYAQLAIEAGVPGEAKTVLEMGMSKNAFNEPAGSKERNQRLLDAAKKSAATDQASLPKFETEAKAAKTGDPDVSLGRAYLSYGMNDKAEEAITRGIGKGGLKSPDDAQILLGIAQLRQGKKPDAVKTFKSLKTTDAINQRVAKLWALHAS